MGSHSSKLASDNHPFFRDLLPLLRLNLFYDQVLVIERDIFWEVHHFVGNTCFLKSFMALLHEWRGILY